MATWKTLEEMIIELRRKGVTLPTHIIEDLRAAKSILKLSCMQGGGDSAMKAEELMANVEAYVMTEGQKVLGQEVVVRWLLRLEEASSSGEICGETKIEDKFVTGVPRDQKWVRIEPMGDLTVERIKNDAKAFNLQVKQQNDGKLVVFGQLENLKSFVKKMTVEYQNGKNAVRT